MAAILRDLPFFNHDTTVKVRGRSYRVFPREHPVWVSVSHAGLSEWSPGTPRFPALHDSGFTDALLLHREHLRRWAGLHPHYLTATNNFLHTSNRRIPLYAANLWLHPNDRGKRDEFSGATPFRLDVDLGISICDDQELYPRLPLLGPLAFRPSRMEVCIEHGRYLINARTPRRFWFF
jgi:hypothetical protein